MITDEHGSRCQFIPGPVDHEAARDPERHDSIFCGEPTWHYRLPYCETHTRLCYIPDGRKKKVEEVT